ncbi:MAG: AMP-binding protein [Bacteroidales bacterium]|nr:AMP-binding protein [Bacteroidales bacterium]MDZ4203620.1 AMP-binding protein [Bacteroidales bacterium]
MRTIPSFFETYAERFSNNPLMWEKKTDRFEPLTYSEMRNLVHRFAAGLLSLGLQAHDRVALLSEGRNYWVMSELGIVYCRAICVPLSVKLDELSDIKFRIAHSGCKMVIVSGRQRQKTSSVFDHLPGVEKIILLDPVEKPNEKEITVDELLALGNQFMVQHPGKLEEVYNSVQESDLVNISYTSGTTADPKGIMLTHRNYTANVEQAQSLMDIPEAYRTLLILPWDHAFAHTAGIYCFISQGASMASVQLGSTMMETLKNIPINIKETKPNLLMSVPVLAKNFRNNIEKAIRDKGKTLYALFNFGLKIAYKYNAEGDNKGRGLTFFYKPLYWLFDKILFKKIRASFGGNLEFFIGGGALLDIELQRFFYAIGIPMFQGYGLSEASPIISSNSLKKHKLGSSGFLVANLELKIVDSNGNALPVGEKGEIVVKGENVMAGYWKNEKATAETIKDGWLYTGDMGYMDKDGFLYVLGRFKSLLIASDGEKYSPEGIEEHLINHSHNIEQVMLHNNQNPYTVALIYPKKEALRRYLAQHSVELGTEKAARMVLTLVADDISAYRKEGKFEGEFPERWLPSSFALLQEGFTSENQLVNSTMKIIRGKITERYTGLIDMLYTSAGKDIFNAHNLDVARSLFGKSK